MNKTELKQEITQLVESIYTNLHKLEYSSKHVLKAKKFLDSKLLKQIHRIAYVTSAYKGEKKEYLENLLKEAKKLMECTESAIKSVHTYEAFGVEFVEHEDCVGICSVSPKANWQKAMFAIAHHFEKELVFMVRKTNSFEVALMKRWKMPVEDANIEGYYKCRMSLDWQMEVAWRMQRIVCRTGEKNVSIAK